MHRLRRQVEHQPQLLGGGVGLQLARHGLHHRAEVDGLRPRPVGALFHAVQVQRQVDHAQHAQRSAFDHAHQLVLARVERAPRPQQARHRSDARQRRAQVVAGDAFDLLAHAERLAQRAVLLFELAHQRVEPLALLRLLALLHVGDVREDVAEDDQQGQRGGHARPHPRVQPQPGHRDGDRQQRQVVQVGRAPRQHEVEQQDARVHPQDADQPVVVHRRGEPEQRPEEDRAGRHHRVAAAEDGPGVEHQADDEGAADHADQHAVVEEVVDRERAEQQRAGDREAREDLLPVRLDEAFGELAAVAPAGRFAGGSRRGRGVVQAGLLLCGSLWPGQAGLDWRVSRKTRETSLGHGLHHPETAAGHLRGRRHGDGGVFLGIPFAAPPVGPLRWRPPQPPQPPSGVRDALAFAPDVPQPPPPFTRAPRQDEDSLYLNVWTPAVRPERPLPVLVWIFGGGFMGGSGSDPFYDGRKLAGEGAVVVTVNYRCGLFGFLAHPALGAESPDGVSGNYGLLDQLAALRWVRDHIAAFGGDPGCVTAFGFSAGSASIALLLTSPQAQGLFHRAILQSPGAGRPLATLAEAEQAGLALGDDLAALRALPAQDVLARTALLSPKVRSLTRPRVLRPIHDGWLLPRDEREALRGGHVHPMPLLVGSNVDEGTTLTPGVGGGNAGRVPRPGRRQLRFACDRGRRAVPRLLGPAGAAGGGGHVRRHAVPLRHAAAGARHGAAGAAHRKYVFTRRRPGQPDGPHHGAEVAYVFGNLGAGGEPFDGGDEALSRTMRRARIAFAQSGNPGCRNGKATGPPTTTTVLGDRVEAGSGWRGPQLDFIERYYAG
ncbi:carboxylesterase family protein [Ramlibacter terrae]|uniref:Carboxylesterase family protein n=1 Tax=Ramlibacter terrae TaxID=2732511 RepID=A0ABX6P5F5_9BURK|nr:carboxylesterase family protein [Ramlibacter terrae]